MIAVLILCALLICLFRLDLDDARESGLIPTEDVAKTGRNNVTFSSCIMAARSDISETFRLTKPTSLDPTIQDEAIRRFHFRSVQRKNISARRGFS